MCVTLSAERPDAASCQAEEGLSSNVGNRKRKRTRAGLGERIEGTGNSIYSPSPRMIFKQLSQAQRLAYFKGSFAKRIVLFKSVFVEIVYQRLAAMCGSWCEKAKGHRMHVHAFACAYAGLPFGSGISESQVMSLVWIRALSGAWSSYFNGRLSRV